MKQELPNFSLNDYAHLLSELHNAGYIYRSVSRFREPVEGRVVYLRHDVDLHVSLVLEMAKIESRNGIQATYYIPLNLHFNLLYKPNLQVLREILALGHEIGLHYDMTTYPQGWEHARNHLDWELSILSRIIGVPVKTITMHQPHTGQPDLFRSLDEYVHPHDPRFQNNLLYVSDSCRAWRDESLLTCFSSTPPRRLLLTTHPELWLNGGIVDRLNYLDETLMIGGLQQYRDYFDHTIRQAWLSYPATRQHDERKLRRRQAGN